MCVAIRFSSAVRRHVAKLTLFLILGAIVNVAVAWGCSILVLPTFSRADVAPAELIWPHHVIPTQFQGQHSMAHLQGAGIDYRYVFVLHESLVRERPMHAMNLSKVLHSLIVTNSRADNRRGAIDACTQLLEIRTAIAGPPNLRVDAGWPLRSMRGWGPATSEIHTESFQRTIRNPLPPAFSIPLQPTIRGSSHVRLLPLEPIGLGFAINTVFYGLVLWLLFAAPFALRRWRRLKRGLCPKCAYPVGTSDVCTECGAGVHAVRH
jgi:hypothetical protein